MKGKATPIHECLDNIGWEKLVKLSKLNTFPSGFYVQDKVIELKREKNESQTDEDNTW